MSARATLHREAARRDPLGVGLAFNPALADFVRTHRAALDYLEVSPERFWHDRGPAAGCAPDRYTEIPEAVAQLEAARGDLPLLAHGVGLSIATVGPLDVGHVEQVARWHARYAFRWYSEHLAYQRLGPQADWRGIGVMLPPVYDRDTLEDLRDKVAQVRALLDIDVLLENAVNYTPTESAMSDADFLNAIPGSCGADLLLDVHNIYCDAVNNGIDAEALVDALDLRNVREIHVAGGEWFGGLWTDAHSGACPDAVWGLLERVLARANGVRAVTFEIDESYATKITDAAILDELSQARAIWEAAHTPALGDVR